MSYKRDRKHFIKKVRKINQIKPIKGMMKISELKKIDTSPEWEMNKIEGERRMNLSKRDKCFCGSGKYYGDCCSDKTPIQILENHGNHVSKDEKGNIIVGVDRSVGIFEGCGLPRIEPLEEFQHISVDLIKDYNSLWEITKSGWDSVDEFVYPYININGLWWRWDENTFVRPKCNTHNWTKENYKKFDLYLERKNSQIDYPITILGK